MPRAIVFQLSACVFILLALIGLVVLRKTLITLPVDNVARETLSRYTGALTFVAILRAIWLLLLATTYKVWLLDDLSLDPVGRTTSPILSVLFSGGVWVLGLWIFMSTKLSLLIDWLENGGGWKPCRACFSNAGRLKFIVASVVSILIGFAWIPLFYSMWRAANNEPLSSQQNLKTYTVAHGFLAALALLVAVSFTVVGSIVIRSLRRLYSAESSVPLYVQEGARSASVELGAVATIATVSFLARGLFQGGQTILAHHATMTTQVPPMLYVSLQAVEIMIVEAIPMFVILGFWFRRMQQLKSGDLPGRNLSISMQ